MWTFSVGVCMCACGACRGQEWILWSQSHRRLWAWSSGRAAESSLQPCLTRTLISSFKLFVIRTRAQWVHCQPSCILWNWNPFVEEYAWINIWRKIDTEHDIQNCSTAVTLGKWQVGVLQRDDRRLKQAGHLVWSQPATVPSLCLEQCSQSVGSF